MTELKMALAACFVAVLAGQCLAETPDRMIGGDVFTMGDTGIPMQATRDVLAAGPTIMLEGTVAQDTQAAGFDVDVEATTGGDLYAVGFSVNLRGPVGGDMTASAFNLRTGRDAEVSGNARLAGGRVSIDGPVRGALAAVGGKVTLDAEVSGDAVIMGDTITFGPDARIIGSLTYSAPAQIDIPERVIAANRVTYEPYQASQVMTDMRDMWGDWEYPARPTFLSMFSGFLVTIGFFVLIGALFLTLAPRQVQQLRHRIDARPGIVLILGVIGLSILFGLVPVSAMTVVGIPLVPVVLLVIVTGWILGYILGAYVLAMRALRGFGVAEDPAIWTRLLALVVGVTLVALLNFIPVLGWLANFALVLLGIGGMTAALFDRFNTKPDHAQDAAMSPIESNI
jgi:hypothetical protein